MAAFDSNTWYQITDSSKGLAWGLVGSGGVGSWVSMAPFNSSNSSCTWQILPASSSSTFFLRSGDPGPGLQLSSERANFSQAIIWGQPAGMQLTNFSDTSQQWFFEKWPADDLWRLSTVANGTDWILGWQGGSVFMSSNTNNSGGHWEISNRGAINDAAYSTTASGHASSTSSLQILPSTTPPTPSPSPSSAALSTGAIAGIVIGTVLPVLLLLLVILFLCRKLRRRPKTSEPFEIPERQELFKPGYEFQEDYKRHPHELSSRSAVHEVGDTRRAELDS